MNGSKFLGRSFECQEQWSKRPTLARGRELGKNNSDKMIKITPLYILIALFWGADWFFVALIYLFDHFEMAFGVILLDLCHFAKKFAHFLGSYQAAFHIGIQDAESLILVSLQINSFNYSCTWVLCSQRSSVIKCYVYSHPDAQKTFTRCSHYKYEKILVFFLHNK